MNVTHSPLVRYLAGYNCTNLALESSLEYWNLVGIGFSVFALSDTKHATAFISNKIEMIPLPASIGQAQDLLLILYAAQDCIIFIAKQWTTKPILLYGRRPARNKIV